jgi:hypothetical protein
MEKEVKTAKSKHVDKAAGPGGFVFFVAWVGAVIYFVGQVDGFWNIMVAILKSFVWPAYLVYYLLGFLGV